MPGPRILFYDLETSPNLSYVWGQYQQNVIQHVQERHLMCLAYRWMGERKIYYVGQNSFSSYYKKYPDCDLKVCEALHEVFDEADVTVAHNGDRFDKRMANARFLYHGIDPPSPYATVDTLKQARRHFRFNSNKLTDLGKLLGLGVKEATGGFNLWRDCMMGNKAAWRKMERYAKQDIRLLEKVYDRMLPWIDGHPNYNLFVDSDDPLCTNCGSDWLNKRGIQRAQTRQYQRYQCQDCGKYLRSVKCDKNKSSPVK